MKMLMCFQVPAPTSLGFGLYLSLSLYQSLPCDRSTSFPSHGRCPLTFHNSRLSREGRGCPRLCPSKQRMWTEKCQTMAEQLLPARLCLNHSSSSDTSNTGGYPAQLISARPAGGEAPNAATLTGLRGGDCREGLGTAGDEVWSSRTAFPQAQNPKWAPGSGGTALSQPHIPGEAQLAVSTGPAGRFSRPHFPASGDSAAGTGTNPR